MSVRELVLVGLWSHPKKEEVCPAVLDLSHTQDHQRGLLLAQRPPPWTLLRHPFKFKTTFHRDSLGARYLLCISTYEGFPDSLAGKESTCNAGDLGSIPELGRSPGEGNGYPLQYSCLENPRGQRSLQGYSPWGCKELDTTEQLSIQHTHLHICSSLNHDFTSLFLTPLLQAMFTQASNIAPT